MLGLFEFYRLCQNTGAHPDKKFGVVSGAVLFTTFTLGAMFSDLRIVALNFPFLAGVFISELYRNKENPFTNIAFTIMGVVYVVVPLALWNLLVFEPWNITGLQKPEDSGTYYPYILLGYLILMWTNDTGAYIAGKSFGRKKLFERVSPKKTWEGFIGGVVLSICGALILAQYYTILAHHDWLIIALFVSIGGTFGDLAESMFKRSIDVKDSGSILPGHGGILDRFDGVLLSTFFVFAYLVIFKM